MRFRPHLQPMRHSDRENCWEYTPVLYNNQEKLDKASLRKYAADLGLDLKRFDADTADPANAAEVRKDMEDGD